MSRWKGQVTLQAYTLMLSASVGLAGGKGLGGGNSSGSGAVPIWAQLAKLQALQSLAEKASSDGNFRIALYEAHIFEVRWDGGSPWC